MVESRHASDELISIDGATYEVRKEQDTWVLTGKDGKEIRSTGPDQITIGVKDYRIVVDSPSRIHLEKTDLASSREIMNQTLKINNLLYEVIANEDGSHTFTNGLRTYTSNAVTKQIDPP